MSSLFLDDVGVLWRNENWKLFIPDPETESPEELANSVFRFSVYLGLLVAIFYKSIKWFFVIVIPVLFLVLAISWKWIQNPFPMLFIKTASSSVKVPVTKKKKKVKMEYMEPTLNNPWGNPNINDLGNGKLVLGLKDAAAPDTKRAVQLASTDGIVPDEHDLWQKGLGDGLTHHSVAGAPIGDPKGDLRSWLAQEFVSKPSMKETNTNYFTPVFGEVRRPSSTPPYPYLPSV